MTTRTFDENKMLAERASLAAQLEAQAEEILITEADSA